MARYRPVEAEVPRHVSQIRFRTALSAAADRHCEPRRGAIDRVIDAEGEFAYEIDDTRLPHVPDMTEY